VQISAKSLTVKAFSGTNTYMTEKEKKRTQYHWSLTACSPTSPPFVILLQTTYRAFLIKVVYVVLESQYQSALSQAVRSINQNHPNLAIEISGYLVEELRDPETEDFKREIADAISSSPH